MTSDSVPDFGAARTHVIQAVVWFARRLRADGAVVPANAGLVAVEALAEVGLDDHDRVRAATHATLVQRSRDRDVFDEHFPEFWYRLRTGLEAIATDDETGARTDDVDGRDDGRGAGTEADGALADGALDVPLDGDGDLAEGEGRVESERVTDAETTPDAPVATDRRPGTYSAAGRRTAVAGEGDAGGTTVDAATVRRLERALATLSGRRWSSSRNGEAVDVRRAMRESVGTGGVTVRLPARERDRSAFRVCLLVDVSRSVLDAVDRTFLLSTIDSLVADGRSTRVFFFDTDIREVTDVFAGNRDDDDPRATLERAEVDWGGGTRIGTSLATLRRQWPDAVDRRTVTLVVSDGLEVGEIPDLERAVAWLAQRSLAVVWLNPLAVSPAYEPICRGMAAAEPYVDGLFAFGGDADLDEVARQLARRSPHDAVGYEYDFRDRTGGTSAG